jgi:hypothetical protein
MEVQHSIGQIERLVLLSSFLDTKYSFYNRIFRDIIAFMTELEQQRLITRLARQDDNKNAIEHLTKLLDEAILLFGVRLFDVVHVYMVYSLSF